METVRFHFDPRCPWCWQTSVWARRLEELGEVALEWGVFSLEVINLPEGGDAKALEQTAVSGPALRTALLLRDAEGHAAVGAFYKALGEKLWDQVPPPRPEDMPETVRATLTELGFDAGLVDKALGDPATWDRVLEEHNAVVERVGAFGVPTIVLDGGEGPGIFGPVISELPTDLESVELWRHTAWMARHDTFFELKRSRTSMPKLAALEHLMEQRRQKAEAESQAPAPTAGS
jgi:hypothetical protein